jgi:site-specific DNA-methyltransferase (adenine-specific)
MKSYAECCKKFEHAYNDNSLVVNGDSLSVLNKLPTRSVDLIFADPPYGIGKNFGTTNDTWETPELYASWSKKWINECMRILKLDGTMYFMSSTQYMPILDVYVSKKYYVINRIIWSYDSSGVQAKNKFGSLYEPILMFTHNNKSKYKFNCKDILIDAPTGAKRKLIDYRKNPPQPYNTKKVPGNVWDFSRVRFRMEEYENHPTQKPEALLERIIKASSNFGDVVLDPFSGSFTTSAVAIKNGRKAIGIDIDKNYYLIGLRRSGITYQYENTLLYRDKSRKTNNLSKTIRRKEKEPECVSLFEMC